MKRVRGPDINPTPYPQGIFKAIFFMTLYNINLKLYCCLPFDNCCVFEWGIWNMTTELKNTYSSVPHLGNPSSGNHSWSLNSLTSLLFRSSASDKDSSLKLSNNPSKTYGGKPPVEVKPSAIAAIADFDNPSLKKRENLRKIILSDNKRLLLPNS